MVRDCEHPSADDLIADGVAIVEPKLPVLSKVSRSVDALRLAGTFELVGNLWAQLVVTGGRFNTEVAWTRDEVLVGSAISRSHLVQFQIYIVVFCF